MPASANLSKILFGLLLLNTVAILAVPALRPAFANQETEQSPTAALEIQIPDDPPSLPGPNKLTPAVAVVADEKATPDTLPAAKLESTPDANSEQAGPANRMVLDEILKAIQDGREDLSVPRLSYPPVLSEPKTDAGINDIDQLSLRFRSLAEVTRSAQALLKEAEQLKAKGKVAAAREITEHVRTLKSIIVQLAADEAH